MFIKFTIIPILTALVFFRSLSPISALENGQKINKFGIHITNPSDLEKAAELVNSNGGDWGWVTMVIQETDRNKDKWQGFFNQCRILHLIPIVRIATFPEGDVWSKPKIEQAESWYDFLNSLNWPISDRYVIVYNEPNHNREWGGRSSANEYAKILDRYLVVFSKNSKFRILNAGMDLAAPNGSTTKEAFGFLQEMNHEVPGIFNRLSGWSSHSYPNHGYLGKPNEYKKTSIRGYEFELNYLKSSLGLKIDLPIFITETGWPYEILKCKVQGSKSRKVICNSKYYTPEKTAEYIKYAYENYWLKDTRVVSVTPFTLNYPYPPFLEFSWLNIEGSPSAQFITVTGIPKIQWQPFQESKYEIKILSKPKYIPGNYEYQGMLHLKNTGESIFFENQNQTILRATSSSEIFVSDLTVNKRLMPGESSFFNFTIKSSSTSGTFNYGWGDSKEEIRVLPESIITTVSYTFWQKIVIGLSNLLHKSYN